MRDLVNQSTEYYDLLNKIKDFQVIIIYNQDHQTFNYSYLDKFPNAKIKRDIKANKILPLMNSETFAINQDVYESNYDLFHHLRLNARKEIIKRITEFFLAKIFIQNEKLLQPILENNTTLKWKFLDELYNKCENIILNNSNLFDHQAWHKFNEWYKRYLVNVMLNKINQKEFQSKIKQLDVEEINQLFLSTLNENFKDNSQFVYQFTKEVNYYFTEWSKMFFNDSIINDISFETILETVSVNKYWQNSNVNLIYENYYTIMSNLPYYLICKTMANFNFTEDDLQKGSKVVMPIDRIGKMTGEISLDLKGIDLNLFKKHRPGQYRLTEIVIDIIDLLNSHLLEQHSTNQAQIEISINTLLKERGLQEKLGGNGYRGGFDQKQKKQVAEIFNLIQNISLHLKIEGNANKQKTAQGALYQSKISKQSYQVRFGQGMITLYQLNKNQIKMMHKQIIAYDPYQHKWEKRIARYISWRWRTQARKQAYMQPYKIGHLLETVGLSEVNTSSPSVVRDRFEKALDKLTSDQVISSWQYFRWDEKEVEKKGWLNVWKQATIVIIPPDILIKHYQSIGQHSKPINVSQKMIELDHMEKPNIQVIERISEIRNKHHITLETAARQIGVSLSYLSHIERGIKMPSTRIYNRIKRWLDAY